MKAAAVVVALGLLLGARPSAACSCGSGPPRFLAGPLTRLPKDARGVVYWTHGAPWVIDAAGVAVSPNPPPRARDFAIERLDPPKRKHSVRVEPLVEPAPWSERGRAAYGVLVLSEERLKPGRYRFVGPERSAVTVTVDASSLSESKPFALVLSEEQHGRLQIGTGGSCMDSVGAVWRALEVKLPPELRAYAPSLLVHTRVDGELWRPSDNYCKPTPPGRSWKGTGKETLFAVCAGVHKSEGLAPGKHRVRVEVVVPGGGLSFTSTEQEFSLTCPPPPQVSAPTAPAEPPSGCGSCTLGGRSPPAVAWFLIALGLLRRRITAGGGACRANGQTARG
jgi:hypothetical protein